MIDDSSVSRILLSYVRSTDTGSEHTKEAMDFTSISSVLESNRPLNDRELSRAIRIAIAAEHDAVHLYELIADSTKNSDIKEVLEDVAAEEKVHVGELEILLNTLDRENKKLQEEGKAEVKKLLK